jgi:hypothetical protein
MQYYAQDFIKHLNIIQNEKDSEDIFNFNESNPFWTAAKEILDSKEFKILMEEIIGKERRSRVRRKRRNIRYRNS